MPKPERSGDLPACEPSEELRERAAAPRSATAGDDMDRI
jgi:hypothetical protein